MTVTLDPSQPPVPPRRAARLLLALIAGVVAMTAATLLLPFDRRIAWRQGDGTIMLHARWIYERIHDDPAPIEVAVVGSSRMEAGISPRVLGDALSARAGRRVTVANLSIIQPGRDFVYEIVRDLLDAHPEVRLLVLSDDGLFINSHPMFRETAPVADVVGSPLLVNTQYAPNLLFLPWRGIANAAEALAPRLFGVSRAFVPHEYLGTGFDRTLGYRSGDGKRVNGYQHASVADLVAFDRASVALQVTGLRKYRRLPPDMAMAVDHAYTRRIVALARRRGVRVAFMMLPYYGPWQSPPTDFYRRFGPDVTLPGLSGRADLYFNGNHLNRWGAVLASRLAADRLAPLLAKGPPARVR